MKKIITAALLSAAALGMVATSAAAEINVSTTGDVSFQAPDEHTEGGNPTAPEDGGTTPILPIIPGEEGEEDELDGNFSNGPLRLEFVPNFHFGTQDNSSVNQSYHSLFPSGQVTEGAGSTELAAVPLFAQVTDERGLAEGKWQLSIQQSSLFSNGTTDLANTRVRIHDLQAFNSNATAASETAALVGIPSLTSFSEVATDYATTLMWVKDGQTTNGSRTSLVFSDAATYTPLKDPQGNSVISSFVPTTEDNAGLQLFVPGSDVTEAGETYTATFTWELADTYTAP